MSEFSIITATPAYWVKYKTVRLNALKDAPDSFGATYAQEAVLSDAEWRLRLDIRQRRVDALPLLVEVDGLVGNNNE